MFFGLAPAVLVMSVTGACLAQEVSAERVAMPMLRDGTYAERREVELRPSAADNLFVTAPAYPRLFIAMMETTPLRGRVAGARTASVLDISAHAPCKMEDPALCPLEAGQARGWSIARFADAYDVFHAGTDRGENAIVVYDIRQHAGWVIFANGGNGTGGWLQLMETLAPEHAYFRFVRSLPQVREKLEAMYGGQD